MMTTLTIVASTLPTALALGRGAQFRQSVGVVVEGGIILSLALTLLVVPSAYVLYDNLTNWISGRMRAYADSHRVPDAEFGIDTLGGPDGFGDSATPTVAAGSSARTLDSASTALRTRDGKDGDGRGNGHADGKSASTPAIGKYGSSDGLGNLRRGKYGRVARDRRDGDDLDRLLDGDDLVKPKPERN